MTYSIGQRHQLFGLILGKLIIYYRRVNGEHETQVNRKMKNPLSLIGMTALYMLSMVEPLSGY